jgi:hypothetical protein
MHRLAVVAAILMLGGCSSFKLGSVMYCAYGETCSMQSLPLKQAPAPAKAASAATLRTHGMM